MAGLIAAAENAVVENGASQDIALLPFPLGVLALLPPGPMPAFTIPSVTRDPSGRRVSGSPGPRSPTTGALGQVRFSPVNDHLDEPPNDGPLNQRRGRRPPTTQGGGAVYGLGIIGASVWYCRQAVEPTEYVVAGSRRWSGPRSSSTTLSTCSTA